MKRTIVVMLALWVLSAQAEPVGLSFRQMKIAEFADVVLRGILKRDYVLASEVARLDGVVTVVVRSVEREKVLDVVRGALASQGVQIAERDGLLYVEKKSTEPGRVDPVAVASKGKPGEDSQAEADGADEVVAYFPQHRPAELLAAAVKLAGVTVLDQRQGGDDKDRAGKRHAVVYAGSASARAKAMRLLAELDRPSPVVNVRAVLLEVSEASESAHSIAAVFNLLRGKLGVQLSAGKPLSNALSLSGASLDAVLSAVDGDSRFKYLSEPSLRVMDGETARLVVGSDVPVRGAAQVDRNGNTLQSIEYRTAGVVITLEPRVLEKSILLKIGQQISSFATTTTSGIDSPTMQKREAQTVLDVADGDLVVLAGLDETKDSRTRAGLSWLPSLFGAATQTQSRSQVLLLLEVQRQVQGVRL